MARAQGWGCAEADSRPCLPRPPFLLLFVPSREPSACCFPQHLAYHLRWEYSVLLFSYLTSPRSGLEDEHILASLCFVCTQ